MSPFATTTRRAEISSPVDSVTTCRSGLFATAVTLALTNSALFGNLGADRVDERVVEDAVLIAAALLDHATEARDPALAVERAGAQHRVGKAGAPQDADLRAVELLAAKIGRIDRVRIDQDDTETVARQHRGCGRAGKAAAGNDDIGVPHGDAPFLLRRLLQSEC